MKKFQFKYFNGVEWAWMLAEVLAETQEQAEQFLRAASYVSNVPYSPEPQKDSLRLISEEDVSVPSFASEPRREQY